LKKKIGKDLYLYFLEGFPYRTLKTAGLPHRTLVGIGGNVGEVPRRFKKIFFLLKNRRDVKIVATSPLLKNPPFGYLEQKPFYNGVILFETSMRPEPFLRFLLNLERRFKRERLIKNGPRTVDLDIIFFDDLNLESESLKIPHPGWKERESVLIPMSLLPGGVR